MADEKKSAEEQILSLLGQVAFLQVTVRALAYAVVRRIAVTPADFEFFRESVEKGEMPASLRNISQAREGWDTAREQFPKDFEAFTKSIKELSHLQ